jgi:hypothetical protein
MKLLIATLIALSAMPALARSPINWTLKPSMSSNGTAATLINILKQIDDAEATGLSVTVETEDNQIMCRAFSHGMLAVQQHACLVADVEALATPVSSVNSLQAKMQKALKKRFDLQKRSTIEPGTLLVQQAKADGGIAYRLDDKKDSVTCIERSAGAGASGDVASIAVQVFYCQIKSK